KKFKIKATSVLYDDRKELDLIESEFRFASSDKNIATVNKKGKVTAKNSGTCFIWVYGLNGSAKKVKITVK
ncbi:MAG: Ig-like domain-containing protein, partial [Lachnospiraceae bacterium]|nr:Ig-like domain-containing protein [Lachnospiraceae bacterium]